VKNNDRQVGQWLPLAAVALAVSACGGGSDQLDASSSASATSTGGRVIRLAVLNTSQAAPTSPTTGFTGQAYYIDAANGNDANSGLAGSPWKTLARAKTKPSGLPMTYASGDAVLLKCGGTWRESLSLDRSNAPSGGLTLGAYGTCNTTLDLPVVSGADVITGVTWLPASGYASGTVYVARLSSEIKRTVYWGGAVLTRARHPNYGGIGKEFSLVQSSSGANSMKLSAADFGLLGAQNLSGAELYLRTNPFIIENAGVVSNNTADGTLTLDWRGNNRYPPAAKQGYYLEGKLAFLDQPGEWHYDKTTNDLYVWLPGGVSPATGTIETAQRGDGITLTQLPDSRIEKIVFDRQINQSVRVIDSRRTKVDSVFAVGALGYGISVEASAAANGADSIGAAITRSTVLNSARGGISLTSPGIAVTSTRVENTGVDSRSYSGIGTGAAVIVHNAATNLSMKDNQIVNSAYTGITVGMQSGVVIQGNLIDRACVRLTDCGAIYAWSPPSAGSAVSTIAFNTLTNLKANTEGSVGGAPTLVAGIYSDEGNGNWHIHDNAISNVGAVKDLGYGFYLHKSYGNLIERNTVWQVSRASLGAHDDTSNVTLLRGNTVQDNKLFASRHYIDSGSPGVPPEVRTVYAQEWQHYSNAEGMFQGTDRNVVQRNLVYTLTGAPQVQWALMNGFNLPTGLGLSDWSTKTAASGETVSQAFGYAALPVKASPLAGTPTNLLQNPTFQGPSLSPWALYTRYGTSTLTANAGGGADFRSGDNGDNVHGNLFSMASGPSDGFYFIRFRARALNAGATATLQVSNASNYQTNGFVMGNWGLSTTEDVPVAALFKPANSNSSLLFLYTKAGMGVHLRDVQLFQAGSYALLDPARESALLSNETSSAKIVPCPALRTCSAVDVNGTPVTWPVTLPANSSLLVVTGDREWAVN